MTDVLFFFALSIDEGGMFKSKQVRRETRGAAEIRDSRETRIDLPVDQYPAQQIHVRTYIIFYATFTLSYRNPKTFPIK